MRLQTGIPGRTDFLRIVTQGAHGAAMRHFLLLPFALLGACAHPAAATSVPPPAMLPDRTLHCTVGLATNLDPGQWQTIDQIHHEGAFPFALRLPAAPRRVGPAPDPTDAPEPVDPATRVTEDPHGIAADVAYPFYRVVDLWPERVEIVTHPDEQGTVRLIIVSEIDPVRRTANIFTTRARDAASLDLKRVYQGGCRIETAAP